MGKTLILTYHNIVHFENNLNLYDVNFERFKEQMKLVELLLGSCTITLPTKGVTKQTCDKQYVISDVDIILSFDDGYCSWPRSVLYLLKRLNFKAYFFICIKNLEDGEITKNEIIRLKENGMIIGSHSMTHCFLNELNENEICYELNESKKILEDIIQEEVKYFSIPRGVYNETVIAIAKKTGYEKIFTSDVGINNFESFILKRVAINRNMGLEVFKNILNETLIKKIAFQQKVKDKAKKILGISNYNRIRRVLVPRAE